MNSTIANSIFNSPTKNHVLNSSLFLAGASITACRATGRHILALEKDKEIFEAILQPMKKSTPPVVTTEVTEPPPIVEASQDPDAMTVVPRMFVRRDRPRK